MAYTDRAGKIILEAWGVHSVTIGDTVVPGDLLGPAAATDNFVLADEDEPQIANCVALEEGVSGDVIKVALAAVFMPAPTPGNPPTAVTLAASTDIGSPLYLSATAGKASLSVGGTTVQHVGYVLSTTSVLLVPGVSLSGTNLTLSGALSVGTTAAITGNATITGTLTQTGAATFAARSVHSAGLSIPVTKSIRWAATSYTGATDAIAVEGIALLARAGAVDAATLAAGTAGDIVIAIANTAYAHTVTVSGGVTFNGGTTIATFGGAIGDAVVLYCVSATKWVSLSAHNVTFS